MRKRTIWDVVGIVDGDLRCVSGLTGTVAVDKLHNDLGLGDGRRG